ncbi:uncharacterized protein N7518_005410 [Penicillium psychrosexuale]|uniref:uncharacterized protein n=1 Tax=Penicillium psychrosexuale TaxID=1002107 RepID=UPI002545B74A|nr:uncharacterized protein N7518_005410 [Penicillium psychrosexuale]KAJ5796870.1 hypothetical protein N7518_005410 [Penicillium psychrosexuale]
MTAADCSDAGIPTPMFMPEFQIRLWRGQLAHRSIIVPSAQCTYRDVEAQLRNSSCHYATADSGTALST